MSEPTTIEEMHARYQAARGRMEKAGREHTQSAMRAEVKKTNERANLQLAAPRAEADASIRRAIGAEETLRQIVTRVAHEHGYCFEDIVGPRRFSELVQARCAVIFEIRRLRPDMSLPQIGRLLKRDHTTILHALRKL